MVTTYPAMINCNVASAVKGKQGFMADSVISSAIDLTAISNFHFCLRPIGQEKMTDDGPAPAKDQIYTSFLTTQEAQWIINPTAKGGAGLALMPLYGVNETTGSLLEKIAEKLDVGDEAQKWGVAHAQVTVASMNSIGFPTGITVWLDMGTVEKNIPAQSNSADKTQFIRTYTTQLVNQGYSVGYYYSDLCGAGFDICPPCSPNGVNTLQVAAGPSIQMQFNSPTLTIGDNSGPNAMRWIQAPS